MLAGVDYYRFIRVGTTTKCAIERREFDEIRPYPGYQEDALDRFLSPS